MPGEAVPLGPFSGGMNTLLDPSAISDKELADIVNFDVDVDGSLKGRPPITTEPAHSVATRHLILGIFPVTAGNTLIASSQSDIYALRGGTWSTIKAGSSAKAAVQYKNTIYVVSDSAGSGGKYSGTTWTDIGAIPKGDHAAIFKERLFIIGGKSQESAGFGSRLYYSDATNVESFPASNFIDIGPGDGEWITAIIVYNENLIIFKNDSTYILSYDTNPGLGTIRKISPNVGATRTFCVAQNESEVYVLHEGDVYELVNYNYSKINTKVPFLYDPTLPASTTFTEEMFLSVVGERLICRYYNRVYCYNFISRAWSRWKSTKYFGPLVKDPSEVALTGFDTYYAGAAISPQADVYRIKDGYTGVDTESMECSITSKVYSIAEQSRYKRLFWWGADIMSKNAITAKAQPITDVFSVTWDEVGAKTWDELHTWDSPLFELPTVDTTVAFSGGARRRFVKFMKGLRFRQIQFFLDLTSDGTEPTARLFNFVTYVAAREKVVKQVS